MIYIVVLNWNSAQDTIKCVKSLLQLKSTSDFKLVVCDNDSKVESFNEIKSYLEKFYSENLAVIGENNVKNHVVNLKDKITLIKNNKNYGYAGGNNVGLRLALNQKDVQYCWVLNNDTEVDSNALIALVNKMASKPSIGICGSRLVEMKNRYKVQALGGIVNKWFCTTKEIGSELTVSEVIDESEWENKIDFVVGASLFFSRKCLEEVGLLCEDYFLYYEELDYCNRVKQNGFKVGIASQSIVFHEQGVSTGKGVTRSEISDYCQVKNRILVSKKFYKNKTIFVKLSIFLVVFNRVFRLQFKRACKYLNFILE
ncbi:glycosyltransferase family 2 protein [Acinetobacter boissieri]|uniref:Glycosyltransferase 2-like domain-containing protein n=1 Tax=Acinetobacter boissieri TaxID=1219383 RepID=A0A1G6HKX1_9GAMM|nr:glycosyltransferase family 2 protein [Acinetobacter boissieri]SDB94096.1 hypothetical protein SAMN05421733_10641 [Acinetobacter boissieri]